MSKTSSTLEEGRDEKPYLGSTESVVNEQSSSGAHNASRGKSKVTN